MGDSGYTVYRRVGGVLEEIFHSEDLVHDFNLPYQVGTCGDDPRGAHCESHVLYHGDVIVLATDGLWDNVYPKEIKEVVEAGLKAGNKPCLKAIATKLASEARQNVEDT